MRIGSRALKTYIEKNYGDQYKIIQYNESEQKMIREKQDIGKYLSGESYQIGSILDLTILNEGEDVESQFVDKDGTKKKIFEIAVNISQILSRGKSLEVNNPDKVYLFGLSAYNENQIIDQLGKDSVQWIGATISVIVESSSKAKSGKRLSVLMPDQE